MKNTFVNAVSMLSSTIYTILYSTEPILFYMQPPLHGYNVPLGGSTHTFALTLFSPTPTLFLKLTESVKSRVRGAISQRVKRMRDEWYLWTLVNRPTTV